MELEKEREGEEKDEEEKEEAEDTKEKRGGEILFRQEYQLQ